MNPGPMSPVRRVFEPLKDELITRYLRVISGLVGGAFVLFGWSALFNPHGRAHQREIYNLVERLAPMQTWGFLFWVSAAIMIVAAISGRAVIYVIGIVTSGFLLAAWCTAIIIESRVNQNAHLGSQSLGLYALAFTAVVGMAFSPQQIVHEKEIVGRVGGTVVPLHREDSKTAAG